MKKNILAAILVFALLAIPVAAHVSGNEQVLYATDIAPDTTVSQLDGLTVMRDGQALASDSLVATGDIIVKDGREYTAVVMGDVDGDSAINSTDFMRVRRAYLGAYELTDVAFKAADVNNDGVVNSTDFMRIRRHFLATYVIAPEGDIVFGQPTSVPASSQTSSQQTSSEQTSSETPSSKPTSSAGTSSVYSIVIGPGEDESGWGPIF